MGMRIGGCSYDAAVSGADGVRPLTFGGGVGLRPGALVRLADRIGVVIALVPAATVVVEQAVFVWPV